jgi:hypothetical protein
VFGIFAHQASNRTRIRDIKTLLVRRKSDCFLRGEVLVFRIYVRNHSTLIESMELPPHECFVYYNISTTHTFLM